MEWLLIVYIAFCIGLYLKLMYYGAPKSSVFYVWVLPVITVVSFMCISYQNAKEKKIGRFRTVIVVVKTLVRVLMRLNFITGLLCVYFGTHKIGFSFVTDFSYDNINEFCLRLVSRVNRSLETMRVLMLKYDNGRTFNQLTR